MTPPLHAKKKTLKNLQIHLENEIHLYSKWFDNNPFNLNIKRTELVLFNIRLQESSLGIMINNLTIEPKEKTKFLVVNLDNNLN